MKVKYEISLVVGFVLLFMYSMPFIEFVSNTNIGSRLFYGWASFLLFINVAGYGINKLAIKISGEDE